MDTLIPPSYSNASLIFKRAFLPFPFSVWFGGLSILINVVGGWVLHQAWTATGHPSGEGNQASQEGEQEGGGGERGKRREEEEVLKEVGEEKEEKRGNIVENVEGEKERGVAWRGKKRFYW